MPKKKSTIRSDIALSIDQQKLFKPSQPKQSLRHRKEENASEVLQEMIANSDYENALKLFKALLESSRFSIGSLWETGVELIGTVEPAKLTDYLHGVYICSQGKTRLAVFHAYIDNLMLEKRWQEALDELELRRDSPKYQTPALLDKISTCKKQLGK
ncbi:hypothetical protein RMATCC62417_02959 [Rhizopus microsporus]|nr:hypothetical protein RMATCC62417_02959 [Rhizopus microsporus]